MSESSLDRQVGGTHYKMPIQHVEFCQKNNIPWCESSAIKYICRHKKKNGRQDLEKAIHYLEMLLEMEYPLPKEPTLDFLADPPEDEGEPTANYINQDPDRMCPAGHLRGARCSPCVCSSPTLNYKEV